MPSTTITFKNTPKYSELSFNSNQDTAIGPGGNTTGTNVSTCRYEGFSTYIDQPNPQPSPTTVHQLNIDSDNYNISALYIQMNLETRGSSAAQLLSRTCYIQGVRRGNEITSNAEFIGMASPVPFLFNFSGQGLLVTGTNVIYIGLRLLTGRTNVQGFYRIYESNYS